MGEPHWRHGASAERGASFPGYLPSEPLTMTSHHVYNSNDLLGSSSDYLPKDILPSHPGAYGVDNVMGVDIKSYRSPVEDPSLISQRRDMGISSGITSVINDRPGSSRQVDGHPATSRESNILFVDGLPNDCSRREVGHLFRPFIGFRELRVIHKEPRHNGDKAMVLCFVEFTDAKCALTALEALQDYKFDDRKPDSPILRIHFAHFPFRLPSHQR